MSILWYEKPAEVWEEALPLGNGRLGAMVFGGTDRERIQVNEETMWYGGEVNRLNPDAKSVLPKVRELIEQGHPGQAQELMGIGMTGCPCSMHPYQTLGDLYLYFDGGKEVQGYKRSLDLENACCNVEYSVGETQYLREYFISKPGDAMVVKLTAKGSGTISFQAKMGRGHFADGIRKQGDRGIYLYGNLGAGGSYFGMLLRGKVTEGSLKAVGETLVVDRAKEVYLYFTAKTTYGCENPGTGEEVYAYLEEENKKIIDRLEACSYETIRGEHVADYRELFARVEFTLGDEEEKTPTDKRLAALKDGKEDTGLQKMLFDYGRYLLISSSRPGGLPANLQGIWNQDFTPPWESKYTININAQMNYWPAEVCNLSECHEPLFDLLEKVRNTGRRTAREMYGCRGFTAHHNTDIHGDSAPQDLWYPATYWTLGGAWLCTHLWTHYLYTKDEAFLEKVFPTMAEAALFFVDFLTEWKGYQVTNPSVSPENTYILPNGEQGCCCMGPTMDNQILRDLFTMCQDAYEILKGKLSDLKISDAEDIEELMESIGEKKEKLMPTRIGSDGRIMEWLEEYEEAEPGHRHISHLYGLYPSDQISVDGTPELAKAAEKTLEYRLKNGGGHTGWSIAWITNHYAKLWDGEKAYGSIMKMLKDSTYPNMFDKHPPFQIDGNFGVCAAIANMLVQSNKERVVLLPALPKAWEWGNIKGLRLQGNAEIALKWQEGKLSECRIKAFSPYETTVVYGQKRISVCLDRGEEVSLGGLW